MLNFNDQNPHPTEDTAPSPLIGGGHNHPPDLILTPTSENGDRYPIRLLAIGIPPGVNSVIGELHVKHFADMALWSPAMKAQKPGEVIRVMTRYFLMN